MENDAAVRRATRRRAAAPRAWSFWQIRPRSTTRRRRRATRGASRRGVAAACEASLPALAFPRCVAPRKQSVKTVCLRKTRRSCGKLSSPLSYELRIGWRYLYGGKRDRLMLKLAGISALISLAGLADML